MKCRLYLLLLSALTILAAGPLSGAPSAKRPNIILIMSDDMGVQRSWLLRKRN